jgi:hypothetical protein
MQLSDRHIDEFIVLYQKHYGVVLERAVALEKGLQLCRFVELVVFEPENGNEYDRNKTR